MISRAKIESWFKSGSSPRGISYSWVIRYLHIFILLLMGMPVFGQGTPFSGGFEIMNKGIMIPQMSAADRAGMNPVDGLMVYDTSMDQFFYYSDLSGSWLGLSADDVANTPLLLNLLTTENGTVPNQPSTASYWDIGGNLGANHFHSDPPLLGNVDEVPFIFITNDQERMRLREDGNIQISRSLEIGENLTVKQNVELNTDGGETINYGALTVERTSPTYLTGILTVDSSSRMKSGVYLNEEGGETINYGALTVERTSPTYLTGTLTVDSSSRMKSAVYLNEEGGETINYGPLTVERTSPTYVTGTLTVDSSSRMKSAVYLNEEGGETINYGALTVERISPTYLTGILTVDSSSRMKSAVYLNEDGGETINYGALTVERTSPTYLTGILTVDSSSRMKSAVYLNEDGGETINYGPLTVERTSPTYLTGILTVDSLSRLKGYVLMNEDGVETINYGPFMVTKASPSLLTGTLTVDQKTRLNNGLTVRDSTSIFGVFSVKNFMPAQLTGIVKITDTTTSDSSMVTTGALVIGGGVGIGQNINIGGDLYIAGTATFGGEVSFNEPVTISAEDQSASISTGALRVAGGTGIKKNLNVGGASIFLNKLTVNQSVDLNDALVVTGRTTLQDSLSVYGAGILSSTLMVNGNTKIDRDLTINGMTAIDTSLSSNAINHGALTVFGGVGIVGTLNIGTTMGVTGGTTLKSTMGVTGATTLKSTMGVTGATTLKSTLDVMGQTTTLGTVDVVGATTTIIGIMTTGGFINQLKNKLSVTGNGSYVAEFGRDFPSSVNNLSCRSSQDGLRIKITNTAPSNVNNFVTFTDASNDVVGRIEGQTEADLVLDPKYKRIKDQLELNITIAGISAATVAADVLYNSLRVYGHLGSATLCAGFGVCVTSPIQGIIYAAYAGLAASIAQIAIVGASLVSSVVIRDNYVRQRKETLGVTYQSGAGDYAEWLPKADPDEELAPGYIIGVKNGKISMSTAEADNILVISTNPIVLGNMPPEGSERDYEKVAFLGQVPVYVMGQVTMGDYILPSGMNDGLGRAVAPSKMTARDYTQIVGMAWSASTGEIFSRINVAIGLNDGDVNRLAIEQREEIERLQKQINDFQQEEDETDALLADLVPGYREALGIKEDKVYFSSKENESLIKENSNKNINKTMRVEHHEGTKVVSDTYTSADQSEKKISSYDDVIEMSHEDVEIRTPDPSEIVYYQFTREQMLWSLDFAEKQFVKNGGDLANDPFWSRVSSDPGYKESVAIEMEELMQKVSAKMKEFDRKSLRKN